jgi:hypothetical protein
MNDSKKNLNSTVSTSGKKTSNESILNSTLLNPTE